MLTLSAGRVRPIILAVSALTILSNCSSVEPNYTDNVQRASVTPITRLGTQLADLPPPARKIDVAVYSFNDQTGQLKPSDNFARFSKAVTQGGAAILIDVLKHVSHARWFNVEERVHLKDVLTERSLIDQTNKAYHGTDKSTLPPLRFAGIIITGGVVDFDSNVTTGGYGARLLGIGSSTQYRRDRVSVELRAVSVATGVVLTSVQTDKTIWSTELKGNVFRYVTKNRLLELDAGTTNNEPSGIAVRKAIEMGVYGLIIQGAEQGLWSFKNKAEQHKLIAQFNSQDLTDDAPAYGISPTPAPTVSGSEGVAVSGSSKAPQPQTPAKAKGHVAQAEDPAPRPAVQTASARKVPSAAPVRTAAARPVAGVLSARASRPPRLRPGESATVHTARSTQMTAEDITRMMSAQATQDTAAPVEPGKPAKARS